MSFERSKSYTDNGTEFSGMQNLSTFIKILLHQLIVYENTQLVFYDSIIMEPVGYSGIAIKPEATFGSDPSWANIYLAS